MENQQNQADQNTQQNYQGPIQSSSSTSTKSKPNYWVASTIVLTIILILVCLFFYRRTSSESSQVELVTSTPTLPIAQPVATEKPAMPSPTSVDQQLKSYDGKYISLSYLPHWYVWHYERTVKELDFFQLNSNTRADQANPNHVEISFEIKNSPFQTLEEAKKIHYKGANDFKERKIDGVDALFYIISQNNTTTYSWTQTEVWVIKNNIMYIITYHVYGRNETNRDNLANQYNPEFQNILNTIKFK
jgi:hypothetical protein